MRITQRLIDISYFPPENLPRQFKKNLNYIEKLGWTKNFSLKCFLYTEQNRTERQYFLDN